MRLRDLRIGQTYWCEGPTDRNRVVFGIELEGHKARYRGPVTVKAIGVPYKKGLGGVLVEATIEITPLCTCSQCGRVHIPAYEDGVETWERTIEFTVHYSSLSDLAEYEAAQAQYEAARAVEWDERLRRYLEG
jgi:hypothetical protein